MCRRINKIKKQMQARERKPPLLEDQFVKKVTILSEPHPTPGPQEGKNATTDLKESEVSFALKHDNKKRFVLTP